MRSSSVLAVLAFAGSAAAQTPLYAVTFGGSLYTLNTTTGAATLVGATGFDRLNAAAMLSSGDIIAARFRNTAVPTDTNKLIRINPTTGAGTLICDFGTARDIRGLAVANGDIVYAIQDNATADSFHRIDLATCNVTDIGPTGRNLLQGLCSTPSGDVFALDIGSGQVYKIDIATGAATLVGGAAAGDNQALEFASGTLAYAARVNLVTVDLVTGTTTVIGPTGQTDIRGLAGFRPSGGGPACYANCDLSTTTPILNVNDFICFNNAFAAGQSYANCDASTSPPVLNVNDFTCFLNAFAAGCS
ncbi:MAG: GC-type dockerin domain-anchored protein [Phycisphaerales bacterium]